MDGLQEMYLERADRRPVLSSVTKGSPSPAEPGCLANAPLTDMSCSSLHKKCNTGTSSVSALV